MTAFCLRVASLQKFLRILFPCLLVGWMIFIFSMSSQQAEESSKTSGGIIEKVLEIVYPGFEDLSNEAQQAQVEKLQFAVRKTAHFSIYAVLGALSFLSFVTYKNLKFKLHLILSGGICLLYALSDEYHQTLVKGRSGELRDVLLDFCGACVAILICSLIRCFIKKRKLRRCDNE